MNPDMFKVTPKKGAEVKFCTVVGLPDAIAWDDWTEDKDDTFAQL
jgi:hypothetical protein